MAKSTISMEVVSCSLVRLSIQNHLKAKTSYTLKEIVEVLRKSGIEVLTGEISDYLMEMFRSGGSSSNETRPMLDEKDGELAFRFGSI